MKNEITNKDQISVKIDRNTHIDMKIALAEIEKKTGKRIDLKEFTTQAIKEKIANSQILNNN